MGEQNHGVRHQVFFSFGCWLKVIHWIIIIAMQTIVELPEYKKQVQKHLAEYDTELLINYLAEHPKAGDLMQGTGGIRKLRWAKSNVGKSGGVRVIYYFHNESMPLFLLSVFGKNEKNNLSHSERNLLAKFTLKLVKNYGG
ncbi:RelE-like translational repressor toxin [hydrothermal vent metagenome]|uniref:RelE-like translational repressor toxin n=1 Tax=hydrothermal vent metagenome TaxID=652676 RepID=A0A3B0WB59_9ZZZZ